MSIYVEGSFANPDLAVSVSVVGRERIEAVLLAARRLLREDDEMVVALARAVAHDDDCCDLPGIWNKDEAAVVAGVLEAFYNGDDASGKRAAARLRTLPARMVVCPKCDGEGEIPA